MNSLGGSRYFVTFIDDKSRRIFIYFMKTKSEVFGKFKIFKQEVERQTGKKIKILRSDNGREYINNQFDSYLQDNGILRQLTVAYTPQQNGVAERANRTLVEMARSMLIHANLPQNLWAEAVLTAVYLRNRSPTEILCDRTPYEVWYKRKPKVSHLRVFGSFAVALNNGQKTKFDPRGKQYIMVGYSLVAKAYRLFDRTNQTIVERRDVIFDETGFQNSESGRIESRSVDSDPFYVVLNQETPEHTELIEGNPIVEEVEVLEEYGFNTAEELSSSTEEDEITIQQVGEEIEESEELVNQEEPKRGRGRPRILREGNRGRPRKQFNVVSGLSAEIEFVPQTPQEAMNCEKVSEWRKAMQMEYDALKKNKTWSLVDLPAGKRVIGCK